MIRYFWVGGILFALLACSTSSKNAEIAGLHMRMGTAHLRQGNYPMALQELLTAEKLDPENAVIQNNLALAYYVRERFKEAESHLKKSLSLQPDYTDARNNIGRVYIAMGKYDEAISQLVKASQDLTYASSEKIYANLSLAHFKKGNFKEAKETAILALKGNRAFCPAHAMLGQALFQLQEYTKASETLDTAISLCPKDSPEARYYSALSYYKLGFLEKAVARLEEIQKLNPESEYIEKANTMLKIIK